MTQYYTLVFLFDKSLKKVVLIEKQKPDWQKGKLNGVGGKVEDNECIHDTMRREFREETGVDIEWWEYYCTLYGKNNDGNQFSVICYYAIDNSELINKVSSTTDEQIIAVNTSEISSIRKNCLGNLPWLIELAIDCATNSHPPKEIHIKY